MSSVGQVILITGSGSTPTGAASGDLGESYPAPSVLALNGNDLPSAGALTVGNILQADTSSTLVYGPLNLAGGVGYVSGLLPTSNQVAQVLSGDLSGSTSSATVIKINGVSVASSPSSHQVLIAAGSTSSSWALLADANISSSAAIASTKLAYSDASSPALGSTTVQGAIDAIKLQAVSTAIQRLTQSISTADLQALGAIASGSINIGSALPTNARVIGVEFNVSQALAALGLSVAIATVQGSADLAGSLMASTTLLGTGYFGGTGTNQYLTRSGQQLTITFTLTGALLSALTAGALTVNVFYAVIA
jgi:hypothetical protein